MVKHYSKYLYAKRAEKQWHPTSNEHMESPNLTTSPSWKNSQPRVKAGKVQDKAGMSSWTRK